MADKNWNDKLRERMEEFTQTPPAGLWDAVNPAPAAPPRTPFWKRWAPLWWSFAAVTAAVAAVLVIRVPEGAHNVAPTAVSGLVANADAATDVPAEGLPEAESSVGETEPAASSSQVQKTPVSHSGAVESSNSGAQKAVSHLDTTGTAAPGAEEGTSASELPEEEETSEVQPAEVEPVSDDTSAPVEGSSNTKPSSDPRNPDRTTPVNPIVKSGQRPLLAATLLGAGGPQSASAHTDYGFKTLMSSSKSSAKPTVALLGRNKSTDVEEVFRVDYQFGLMASWSWSEQWGLESGVQYTRLTSYTTRTTGNMSQTTTDAVGYLGIPLHVVFTPWRSGSLSAYLSAGPAVEYGIHHSSSTADRINEVNVGSDRWSEVPGDWVFSASINAGLQYQPWRLGAFFIQPGVVGRLCTDATPDSYYTRHPVSFRLAAGYRFTF